VCLCGGRERSNLAWPLSECRLLLNVLFIAPALIVSFVACFDPVQEELRSTKSFDFCLVLIPFSFNKALITTQTSLIFIMLIVAHVLTALCLGEL